MTHRVEFWFDFASTYSYLSATRIEEAARAHNVEVIWRPFLLGPIFMKQGWNSSPFKVYPIKGKYMWRDMERRAQKYGVAFHRPAPDDPRDFPQHSVMAARIALIGMDAGWGKVFCKRVFTAEFAQGEDISNAEVLVRIAKGVGASDDVLQLASSPENKLRLRAQSERAMQLELFGAPSFTVGDELFWGDDRLDEALEWAQNQ